MNMQLTVVFLVCVLINGFQAAVLNQTNTTTMGTLLKSTNGTNGKKLALYKLPVKAFEPQYMSEVGSRCIDDGFYPDKDDCRKFHVCYSGTQSIRWCKEGMLWDETKIGCSSQNTTTCAGGRKKWGQKEDNSGLVSKSGKGNYTCRSGANGLFADPSSCSIYHWCVLGVLHSTHHCTPGLHFSASASGCVWPKDAECEGQIAPPYSPIECSFGISGYFPDPYDCSVFHYCDGTKLRSESLLCSAGRIWSTRLENCAWPHEVPECQNICPANYSSQMRFADSVVCSQYSQCVDGRLEQRTCPNNFLFDRITKTCKPYEQAECHGDKPDVSPVQIATTTTTTAAPFYIEYSPDGVNKKRGSQMNCFVDGYFGDPQDCNVYHVCADGRDYRSNCAVGLAWEPLLRLCMPTHLVNCQNSKSIDSFYGSSKKKWLHLFTQTAPTITTTTTTTTASTPNLPFNLPSIFTCSGRTNGYYADPIHCNKFHYCGTGWHSVMECEKGLAYSARDHDCVPIELANCAGKRSIRN